MSFANDGHLKRLASTYLHHPPLLHPCLPTSLLDVQNGFFGALVVYLLYKHQLKVEFNTKM